MISILLILRTLSSEAAAVRSYRAESGSGRTGPAIPSLNEFRSRSLKDQGLARASESNNGAGKTTALNAILGLTSYEGQLTVLGRDPWSARDQLMRDVSFIADVAVLPRWIRVTRSEERRV